MYTLVNKFIKLKTAIGGNREKREYEETFGMPQEETHYITPPNHWHRRILGELEFSLKLSKVQPELCQEPLDSALDYLLLSIDNEGVITKSDVLHAEELLSPLAAESKTWHLILAGHAHLDMDWMWSYQETVAATLDTFRTMLMMMDEYPDFHFSQSQASVYKIVEDFDPDMMVQIKARIAEGRWEVTASAWVEQDKNMPSTESMARHILYTKKYLEEKWGVLPASLELDFSPDTFGHSAHMPEIVSHGGVKYYYHCRGTNSSETLYRWKAPSGKELLIYREPYWYNSAITPHIGSGLPDLAAKCGGLKTGLVVYGVGDHGGGPTRRDIERAIEMKAWPIYPDMRFGTLHEFFHEAESVREKLNVVDHELNYILTGCYTTQSRIKKGNRKSETALYDAEALNALAQNTVPLPYPVRMYEKAWQGVLYTHFHDILTGSCVQDSREHAMGLYSDALAVANTNRGNAMRAIAAEIDTSRFIVKEDMSATQSEGAGAGYGIENFSAPVTSRSSGLNRLFHVFNPSAHTRQSVVELTVWDWVGNLARIAFTDADGKAVAHQLVDYSLQKYWDHKYFRVLIDATVPALGYATFQMKEADLSDYPFFYQPDNRTHDGFDDTVMDNGILKAVFDRQSAEVVSLVDKASGKEFIKTGDSAGLRYYMTESSSSNAWLIGRYISESKLTGNTKVRKTNGPLRTTLEIDIPFGASSMHVSVSLDKGASSLQYVLKVDWHEAGKKDGSPIPMLAFVAPANEDVSEYRYDVPGGVMARKPLHHDVPGLQYGAALLSEDKALALVADSKYGYRGADNQIVLTLIHAATSPDPYPERGIHDIKINLGVFSACPKVLEENATDITHAMSYISVNPHQGTLPLQASLLELDEDTGVVISGVKGAEDGKGIIVRLCNVLDKASDAALRFGKEILSAQWVDVLEQPANSSSAPKTSANAVTLSVGASSMAALRIILKQ